MQDLLPRASPGPWILGLAILACPAAGAGGAWLAARLAGASRPGGRPMLAAMAAAGMLTAGAITLRPDALAWSLVLGWTLMVLAGVDCAAFRLPDVLTLPLMAAGLLQAVLRDDDPVGHMAGLLLGYAAVAGVGWAFLRVRGRRGIGLGDAKLFAAGGAWLGWAALPAVMLIGCGLGLTWFAVVAVGRGRQALKAPIPFGVALCGAIWAVWLLQTATWWPQ